MTEAEWLACCNPGRMLEFMRSRVSQRKLRLFATACCRRFWPLLDDPLNRSRIAVEVAERLADGRASQEDLQSAHAEAWEAWEIKEGDGDAAVWLAAAAQHSAHPDALVAANDSSLCVTGYFGDADWRTMIDAGLVHGDLGPVVLPVIEPRPDSEAFRERALQAELLRCILGPVAFSPITLDPLWFSSTVRQLARSTYEDRAFALLPILADALAESGCTDTHILSHCRERGLHERGCWVVDLALEKE